MRRLIGTRDAGQTQEIETAIASCPRRGQFAVARTGQKGDPAPEPPGIRRTSCGADSDMDPGYSYAIGQWVTPPIVTGVAAAIIAALITAFVALWGLRKQLLQQRQQFEKQYELVRQQIEQPAREDEARHKQSVQAFVDYLYDVRTLNRPPQPSGDKLWGIAERRLREVRRRLTETLSTLPGEHAARRHLESLVIAFHAWADEWDQNGDHADTHTGERKLMIALSDLQRARAEAEDKLRKILNLPEPKRDRAFNEKTGLMRSKMNR